MEKIPCPHCEKEVESKDRISGLFDCPHCEEKFEWNTESEEIFEDKTNLEATQSGFLVNIPGAKFRAVLGGSVISTGGLMVLLSLDFMFRYLVPSESAHTSMGIIGFYLIVFVVGVLGVILGVGAVFTGFGIIARMFPALVIGAIWNFLGLIATYLGIIIIGGSLFALSGMVFLASFIAHLLVIFVPSFRFLWFEAA